MRRIVITPVTGQIKQAMTEAYKLHLAMVNDLFGEIFPSPTVTNKVWMTTIREVGVAEFKSITENLTKTGVISSVHLETPNEQEYEELPY
jgi:hypothetical protein